jgi:hypothetical protein
MTDPRNARRNQKPEGKPEQSASQFKSDQPASGRSARRPSGRTGRGSRTRADQRNSRLTAITVTVDADTAQVVRVEGLDAAGARRELSNDEKANLVTHESDGRLEEIVEQAFEAGIAVVLEDDPEPDTAKESETDAELRHLLLTPLIEHSPARRLFERAVLDRAILGTLLEHSMK